LLLDQTRKRFSQLAAQTTITNTSESVVDALNDAFSGNSTIHMQEGRIATSFAAIENVQERTQSDAARSAYAALARRPIPAQHIAQSPWHVWIDARYTSYDDDDNPAFGSRHLNVTGGGSYRFGSLVAGIVLGYENFDYELGLRSAKLDGHGWSGGGYFGWRFLDRLRLDGMLTYGRISYGAQADAVTADFDADRITTMLRLSGSWNPGAWYVEPSARLIYAWENQDSFTDTVGVSQPDYSFNVGVASVGGKVGIPLIWTGGTLTPTVGLFGDYRFGDDTISTVATLPNIDNGWSARLTGGLRWTFLNGLSASIDGDYGGLGQDVRFWRLRASLGAKF
jgi:outer membrane autotransporter protein